MHNKIILLTLFLFSFFIANAQTIHKDYWDGEIYFKIKEESNIVIENINELREEHKDIASILNLYDIKAIDRPFKVLKTSIFDRTYKVWFDQKEGVDRLIDDLEKLSFIEYAERVPYMTNDYVPNDPIQDNDTMYHLNLVSAFTAWDLNKGDGATIAIVDDAVFIEHEDLAANIWENPGEIPFNGIDDDGDGFVYDYNGYDSANGDIFPSPPTSNPFDHGTHCAGIASAVTDNGMGIPGLGFNAKIIACKGKSDNSTGSGLDAIWSAFTYAIASGADVISCSWGGGGYSQSEQNLINQAHANGQVIVTSAGNGGLDGIGDETPQYPAAYNHMIAVANTNKSDVKNGSSNYGDWVDISAPGTSIYSTVTGDDPGALGYKTGTSMSCPMVAGLCALIKSSNPNLTPEQIESCIKGSADDINNQNPAYFGKLGAGRINAQAALLCADPSIAPVVSILTSGNVKTICPGGEIEFSDNSLYLPESWSWSFPGGVPATSNEKNPRIYYPTPGVYDVTLEATNEFGSNTQTFNAYINVDGSLNQLVFEENFESGNTNGWTIDNPTGGTEWSIYNLPSGGEKYGEYAIVINNFDENTFGSRDAIISPKIDLYGRSTATLELDYAFRQNLQNATDSLIISASTDGGLTFPHILFADKEDGSYNVATYIFLNGEFLPNQNQDWCGDSDPGAGCISVDLSSFLTATDFRIKIENVSFGGNNFYVDNIKVTSDCVSSTVAPIANFSALSDGCNTLTTQFFDNSIGVGNSWFWTFPGGTPATSTDRNPIVTYNSVGDYDVTLSITNTLGTDEITKTEYISVNDQDPVANFEIVSLNNNTVVFQNNSTNASSYLWEFGDGISSNLENPYHYYHNLEDGYEVNLTAYNGCSSDSLALLIDATGIDDIINKDDVSLNIFPNPNKGTFTMTAKGLLGQFVKISIFDVIGREVYNIEKNNLSENWSETIKTNSLESGTYIVKIDTERGSVFDKLIIKN